MGVGVRVEKDYKNSLEYRLAEARAKARVSPVGRDSILILPPDYKERGIFTEDVASGDPPEKSKRQGKGRKD